MLKKLITISITAIASLQAATTYDKSLTDGNDNLNYWSDTTDSNLNNHSLSGATEVFTIGSRKNIPNVPTSAIKVSTNKLCSDDRKGLVSCSKSDSLEPRYTDDGLATSGEVNLRTWYKATTPKSVNGVVDDPCPSLSNVGSIVNWAANFPSLRCERTAVTYTNKVYSTIYANKISTVNMSYRYEYKSYWWDMIYCPNCGPGGPGPIIYPANPTYGTVTNTVNTNILQGITAKAYYGCADSQWHLSNRTWKRSGNQCLGTFEVYTTTYSCPSGYSDNGSNCQQTIQVCPDASWTDNGTNCKKNVPEYKLFSTF